MGQETRHSPAIPGPTNQPKANKDQQCPAAIPATKLTRSFSIGLWRANCSSTHTAKELGQIRAALMHEEIPRLALSAVGGLRNRNGQNLAGVLKAGALKKSVLTIITVSVTPNATSVIA